VNGKPKIALHWGASCGGCDIATLAIGDKILELAEAAEIVFWPMVMDFKYSDLTKMADKSIDVCLFNGAIVNSDDERFAQLFRAKSKLLIAIGSCAYEGGIPGLANFYSLKEIFQRVYEETQSTENPEGIQPQPIVRVPEGDIEIPGLFDAVRTLEQTVDVDYFVPGCPPEEKTIWMTLEALIYGKLPPRGGVISHSSKALCEECPRVRKRTKIKAFYRPHQIVPDPERCLLEQGLLCYGIATRGGCGALCPQANMPCTGCYGPVEGVSDQGANFISALGSIIDSTDPLEIRGIIDGIEDPGGTFYRYSLPDSLLRRARLK
jgi:F420-non-reducing hydrogenase small subunit